MNAVELYRNGKLDDAIQVLGAALRKDPGDAQRRIFLFELLCFAGEYDRAEKQLDVLSDASTEAAAGALLYRSALHAERMRQEMFRSGRLPESGITPRPVSGTFNGAPVSSVTDPDPRIGARLEVYAAGQYMWIPLDQLESVRMEPPKRLRDLLWAPAIVRPGPSFQGNELGEVLIPVVTPLASTHPDGEVRLGQVTEWTVLDDGPELPVGQKLLLVDGEECPILELRELVVSPAADHDS
jgi:type VI secretion system protein ImpE